MIYDLRVDLPVYCTLICAVPIRKPGWSVIKTFVVFLVVFRLLRFSVTSAGVSRRIHVQSAAPDPIFYLKCLAVLIEAALDLLICHDNIVTDLLFFYSKNTRK